MKLINKGNLKSDLLAVMVYIFLVFENKKITVSNYTINAPKADKKYNGFKICLLYTSAWTAKRLAKSICPEPAYTNTLIKNTQIKLYPASYSNRPHAEQMCIRDSCNTNNGIICM